MSESFDLLDKEVDVHVGSGGVGDDHAEKVDFVALRLVADHSRPVLHHPGLYHGRHLTGRIQEKMYVNLKDTFTPNQVHHDFWRQIKTSDLV